VDDEFDAEVPGGDAASKPFAESPAARKIPTPIEAGAPPETPRDNYVDDEFDAETPGGNAASKPFQANEVGAAGGGRGQSLFGDHDAAQKPLGAALQANGGGAAAGGGRRQSLFDGEPGAAQKPLGAGRVAGLGALRRKRPTVAR
jgi:hypothetical protein